MNEPSKQSSDAAMAGRQQIQNRQQSQVDLGWWMLSIVTVVTLFILPQYLSSPYDSMSMGFGSAALLTVFVYLYPDTFRGRSGSLVLAYCLVVALWLLAAVTTAVSLLG